MNAILSGLTGKGLLHDGEKFYTVSMDMSAITPVEETSIFRFFNAGDNFSFLEDVTPTEAMLKLQVLYQQQEALDLALMLFDEELSAELRKEAATALEDLLKSTDVRSYLETVLYAKPLPVSTDKEGAMKTATGVGAVAVFLFLKALVGRQKQVALVRRSWDALPMDVFCDQEEQVKAHAIAVDKGLFSGLVECLISDELDRFQHDAIDALRLIRNREEIVNLWVQNLRKDKEVPEHRQLVALYEQIAKSVQTLNKAFACGLAIAWDLTVNDSLKIANRASVAAVGNVRKKFQIPLKIYFHDVLHLSDTIVQLWAKATLSVQLRDEGWRFILYSPPQGWALAVSLGGQIAIVLGEKTQTMKITCAGAEIDRHQMAIVPFEQSP